MLKELVNEIIELLNESDVKDTQINELRAEVEGLKVQIAQLKQELEIANNSIVELNNEVISLNNIIIEKDGIISNKDIKILELQEQANLKLDEVKTIVEELKGMIINA